MTQCSGITVKGNQCKKNGNPFCHIHTLFDCGICLESIFKSTKLDCGHNFCSGCVNTWILEKGDHSSCPMCRSVISYKNYEFAKKWGITTGYLYLVEFIVHPILELNELDSIIMGTVLGLQPGNHLVVNKSQVTELLQNESFKEFFMKFKGKSHKLNFYIKKNEQMPTQLHMFTY